MKKLETSSMSPYPDTAILYQLQIITTFKVDTRYSRLYKVKFIIKVKEWYGPVVLELMIVRLYDLLKDLFKSLQTMSKYIYWTKLVVNYSNTNDRTVKTVNNWIRAIINVIKLWKWIPYRGWRLLRAWTRCDFV